MSTDDDDTLVTEEESLHMEPVTVELIDSDSTDNVVPSAIGLGDADWTDDQWRALLQRLIEKDGVMAWKDATATLLGELNPPQVGTAIASADKKKFGFRENHFREYPKEVSLMSRVMSWLYDQEGYCADCGTRLDLQADHIEGRENFANPKAADTLDNLTLRCRRHNVAKRNSHVGRAGRTALPAQQALMWILLELRPRTRRDFERMCRIYGMTMSNVRMDEAWAMAVWLAREKQSPYEIDPWDIAAKFVNSLVQQRETVTYHLWRWPNGGITRSAIDEHYDTQHLASDVKGDDVICILEAKTDRDFQYYEYQVNYLPFTYELDSLQPDSMFFHPVQEIVDVIPTLPLVGMDSNTIKGLEIRKPDFQAHIGLANGNRKELPDLASGKYVRGRNVKAGRGNFTNEAKLVVERGHLINE